MSENGGGRPHRASDPREHRVRGGARPSSVHELSDEQEQPMGGAARQRVCGSDVGVPLDRLGASWPRPSHEGWLGGIQDGRPGSLPEA
jgi:hypothetical protein